MAKTDTLLVVVVDVAIKIPEQQDLVDMVVEVMVVVMREQHHLKTEILKPVEEEVV
jgi:hypothetical protein